jgi:protein O-GlcNAc transferase
MATPDDYEALALTLARNPAQLAAIRARLNANRGSLPLFDIAKRTRDLESIYVRMAETWRSGAARAPIVFDGA